MMIRMISQNISIHLPKQWYLSNRCVSTSVTHFNQQLKNVVQEDKERWSRLYTLPDMQYLSINTKLKNYPAFVTGFGTPLGYMADTIGALPNFHFFPAILYIGIVSTGILSAFSAVLSRTIGKIDVNQKRDLKVYYIDFLGRQIVKEISVDELRKCKKSDLKFKLYKTIDTTDNKGQPIQLKIAPNRGDIYDSTLFKRIFGKKKIAERVQLH